MILARAGFVNVLDVSHHAGATVFLLFNEHELVFGIICRKNCRARLEIANSFYLNF